MPKLGAYTDDVLLAEWLVGEGEEVEPGARRARARDREDEGRGRGRERRLGPPPCRRRARRFRSARPSALIAETREEYDALAARHGRRRSGGRTGRRRQPVPRLHRPRRWREPWRAGGRRGSGQPVGAGGADARSGAPRRCAARRAARPRAAEASSASRSRTPARSPAPARAAASSTAMSRPGPRPAAGQPQLAPPGEPAG